MTLEQWEDETIREALRRANGNKSQAARALGLSRNALRYRLSKLGVPDPAGRAERNADAFHDTLRWWLKSTTPCVRTTEFSANTSRVIQLDIFGI